MYDLLIKNGIVLTPSGPEEINIAVKDGKICELIHDTPDSKETIDAEKQYVFPGFIDPHVHLNEPGLTNSEDFYTGTCAGLSIGCGYAKSVSTNAKRELNKYEKKI